MIKSERATGRIVLFVILLIGSLQIGSFFLPALAVGNAVTGEAMIWNGETFYSLNGWQVCKLLIHSAWNLNLDFFVLIVAPTFGGIAILANPFFWIGLVLLGKWQWWGATIAAFIAVLLASVAYWTLSDKLLVGFYLWYSSMSALVVVGLIGVLYERTKTPSETIPRHGSKGGAVMIVGALAIVTALGCTYSPDPPVTSADRRIAAESAILIQATLTNLPDSHEIVQRYGKFVSLDSHRAYRRGSTRTLDQKINVAHLNLWCECSFEKYPATIELMITKGNSHGTSDSPLELVMEPSAESVTTGVLSGSKPELRGKELWYVGGENNLTQVNCRLHGRILHPEVVP